MKTARLTIKNYRAFSDQNPVEIEIGRGLTALLGPNNAGKSSLKLFFYEMRDLFEVLLRPLSITPSLLSSMVGSLVDVGGYPGTSDLAEIFNNSNERDMTFEIEVVDPTLRSNVLHTVYRIVATCARSTPQRWSIKTYSVQSPDSPISLKNALNNTESPHQFVEQGSGTRYDLSDLLEVVRAFQGARYYGAFRNALNRGSGQYYDFQIGTAFVDLWNNWKTAGNKAQSRAIGKITEEIRRLFEFNQLEINASVSLHTLLVTIDGHQYRLAELGSGISQFIMVLGNAATARPPLILIDEPETNLHPALQIDFLLMLAQYASEGCLFSTHSVGLARSVANEIFTIRKGQGGSVVRHFESTPSILEFLGELSFSSFRDMGCDRILLVEGVNDVKVVQQLLRLFGKEHTTVILPLGGDQLVRGGREFELQELRRLSQNIFALVDSERFDAVSPPAVRRVQFDEVCKKIGFGVCLTQRRALENYFPDHAVKAAFGQSFEALKPYERLDEHPNAWGKSENWRIAHYLQKSDILPTDVGTFLSQI